MPLRGVGKVNRWGWDQREAGSADGAAATGPGDPQDEAREERGGAQDLEHMFDKMIEEGQRRRRDVGCGQMERWTLGIGYGVRCQRRRGPAGTQDRERAVVGNGVPEEETRRGAAFFHRGRWEFPDFSGDVLDAVGSGDVDDGGGVAELFQGDAVAGGELPAFEPAEGAHGVAGEVHGEDLVAGEGGVGGRDLHHKVAGACVGEFQHAAKPDGGIADLDGDGEPTGRKAGGGMEVVEVPGGGRRPDEHRGERGGGKDEDGTDGTHVRWQAPPSWRCPASRSTVGSQGMMQGGAGESGGTHGNRRLGRIGGQGRSSLEVPRPS
jgi:hypothetical protein